MGFFKKFFEKLKSQVRIILSILIISVLFCNFPESSILDFHIKKSEFIY